MRLKLAASFFLGCLVAVVALVLERELILAIALGLVLGLMFAAFFLWLSERPRESALGAGLLGGLVVAVAVGLSQFEIDRGLDEAAGDRERLQEQDQRAREATARRETFRFTLATTQDLTGIDLHGQNLNGFYIRRKRLKAAELSDTSLQWAILQRSDLYDANLRGADLRRANLIAVDLCGAELDRSKRTRKSTNLANADLWRASLYGAQIETGTNLSGAHLEDADLRARDLKKANLKGAKYDSRTTWPAGFGPVERQRHGLIKSPKPRKEPNLRVKSKDTGCP